MSHVEHIINNKKNIELHSEVVKLIREFFWSQNFTEIDVPIVLGLPGQEPYLNPLKVQIHNENGQIFTGYLHTSPEYALKKALAAGFEKIFSITKTFRDQESFGGTHNPEFTMIEWYRANRDMWSFIEDTEKMFAFLINKLKGKIVVDKLTFQRKHMREVWQEYIGVNLDDYLETAGMFKLCQKKGYPVKEGESYEDLFYRIFLNEIEPRLVKEEGVIIHHYPMPMAALAKASQEYFGYAERAEIYVNGLEIGNGFSELTDVQEQRKRFLEEQQVRVKLGKELIEIDEEFLRAVDMMPPAAGIAVGVDRIVQILGGCQNIDNVLLLPASKLFG